MQRRNRSWIISIASVLKISLPFCLMCARNMWLDIYNRCKSNSGRAINPRCECILMYLELLQLESSTPIEDPELIILGRVGKLVYQREFVILSLLTIGLGDVPSSMVYAILFYKSVAKMSNKLFCSSSSTCGSSTGVCSWGCPGGFGFAPVRARCGGGAPAWLAGGSGSTR